MTPIGHDDESVGSPRYWLLVAALLVINTYAFIDRSILALLVDPIKRDLGASDVQMGLLLGLGFACFYAVSAIPAGHFVDRHNRRTIIGGASVLWAAMTIVCGTAGSIEQLFVGRLGVGIAESVIAPAAFSLIRDAVPRRSRGLAFSLYAMAPLVGGAGSLIIGGHIFAMASAGAFNGLSLVGGLVPWKATLIMVGTFGLPLSLLLLLAPEPARPPIAEDKQARRESIIAGLRAAMRHMRQNLAIYMPLILFVTFGAMANFSISFWMPALIGRTWHMTPQQVGPLLGMIMLPSGVAGLLLSGFVLNRLTVRGGDIRDYGLIAAVASAIGMIGIGIAPSLAAALAMLGLASFFFGTSFSVGATTLSQVTPVRLIGRVTAIYFLFNGLLGQALGPFLVGFGSQHLFDGRTSLAHSFSLWTGIFSTAMIASMITLRARLRSSEDRQSMNGTPGAKPY